MDIQDKASKWMSNICRLTMQNVFTLLIISVFVKFGILTAAVTNAAIFWDITQGSAYVNRTFGETYHFLLQGQNWAERGTTV
jgi:hypothetical protein